MRGASGVPCGGHPPTLATAFLYFGVSCMAWLLVSGLSLSIAAEFGLTAAETGLLVAVPLLGGALVRIPLGLLVDRIGAKRTGLLCQILVLVPLAWGWLGSGGLSEVLAVGLLLGVAGGSFAVAMPLAGRWYPPGRQGVSLGIVGAANGGTALAALLAPRLAESVGWRGVLGLAIVPAAATLLLYGIFARESPARPEPRPIRESLRLLRSPAALGFCLLYGFTFGGFVGLASYLSIFFHEQYGVTPVRAGTLTALCVLAGSVLRPVGGLLADRWGGSRVLSFALVAASLGLAGAALQPGLTPVAGMVVAVMAALGAGNGAVFQLVPLRFRRDLGTVTGLVGSAGGLAGFLLPILLGSMRELSQSYAAGFFSLSLAGAYALAFFGWLAARPEPGGQGEDLLAEAGSRG